ncbi:hypothetical protein BGX33_010604 [Mortierella sp. NVP41]|nr:hypothetical protein BGX33_010604 [Mortierella sp. NVP41]
MATRQHGAVYKIPPELILKVARYLDRSALFKVRRVCRMWHQIFDPLASQKTMFPLFARLVSLRLAGVWYHDERDKITVLPAGSQWTIKHLTIDSIDTSLIRHCPSLVYLEIARLRYSMKGRMDVVRDAVFLKLERPTSLRYIVADCPPKHIVDVHVRFQGDPHKPHCEEVDADKTLLGLRRTRSIEWGNIHESRWIWGNLEAVSQLSSLAVIFRSMPMLTRLSLTIDLIILEEDSLLSFVSLSNLPNLRALYLELPLNPLVFDFDLPSEGPVPSIEKLYPLLSSLDELVLRGEWYENMNLEVKMLPSHAPWRLKTLAVDRFEVSFLQHCPSLESLSFKHPIKDHYQWRDFPEYRRKMSIWFQGMPSLKSITFGLAAASPEMVFSIQETVGADAIWKNSFFHRIQAGPLTTL